jgi:hypothetical protein
MSALFLWHFNSSAMEPFVFLQQAGEVEALAKFILEKVRVQPKLHQTYARLCHRLVASLEGEIRSAEVVEVKILFRRELLQACQQNVERSISEAIDDDATRQHCKVILMFTGYALRRFQRISLCNPSLTQFFFLVTYMGRHLFVFSVLPLRVIQMLITLLFAKIDLSTEIVNKEVFLDSLLSLFTTVLAVRNFDFKCRCDIFSLLARLTQQKLKSVDQDNAILFMQRLRGLECLALSSRLRFALINVRESSVGRSLVTQANFKQSAAHTQTSVANHYDLTKEQDEERFSNYQMIPGAVTLGCVAGEATSFGDLMTPHIGEDTTTSQGLDLSRLDSPG